MRVLHDKGEARRRWHGVRLLKIGTFSAIAVRLYLDAIFIFGGY